MSNLNLFSIEKTFNFELHKNYDGSLVILFPSYYKLPHGQKLIDEIFEIYS